MRSIDLLVHDDDVVQEGLGMNGFAVSVSTTFSNVVVCNVGEQSRLFACAFQHTTEDAETHANIFSVSSFLRLSTLSRLAFVAFVVVSQPTATANEKLSAFCTIA